MKTLVGGLQQKSGWHPASNWMFSVLLNRLECIIIIIIIYESMSSSRVVHVGAHTTVCTDGSDTLMDLLPTTFSIFFSFSNE